MAKRDIGTTRPSGGTTTNASAATAADGVEQRVVAFAEQLGRIVGTLQAKAEGWIDREALNRQIASVRDGAADLLEHLAGVAGVATSAPSVTKASKKAPLAAAATARGATKGRSGGAVDAPGKKHRKPSPADPGARLADSQAAKMRDAMPMAKTNRRRGRG